MDLAAVWASPLETLRKKWGTIPLAGAGRAATADLLKLGDRELLEVWRAQRAGGAGLADRGWYRLLYADFVPGKKILDVGCGFAYDSLGFAEQGAEVTLVDIVETNVELAARVARLLGVDVRTVYLESVATIAELPDDFDVVTALGSLHHAPQAVLRPELRELHGRLKVGGRWWQLAYPYTRWQKEGRQPFETWGQSTDGEGTPWAEWYDLGKLLALHEPARFEEVFYTEWHDGDFNWFDLVLRDRG